MVNALSKYGIQKKDVEKSGYKKYVLNIDKLNASKQIIDDIGNLSATYQMVYKNKMFIRIQKLFKRIYIFLLSNFYNLRRSAYERNKLNKIDKRIVREYIDKIDGEGSHKEYKIVELGKNLLSIENK